MHFMSLHPGMFWLLPLILIEIVFKGIALWRAARNNHLEWYIALLLINSAGILPLIYLLAIDKRAKK